MIRKKKKKQKSERVVEEEVEQIEHDELLRYSDKVNEAQEIECSKKVCAIDNE